MNDKAFDGNYHCGHCGQVFRIADQVKFLEHQESCGKNDKVNELVEWMARTDYEFVSLKDFFNWNKLSARGKGWYLRKAKQILSDPDHPLALMVPCERCAGQGVFHSSGYEYGEDKPITCSQCRGTGKTPTPLTEELKEVKNEKD